MLVLYRNLKHGWRKVRAHQLSSTVELADVDNGEHGGVIFLNAGLSVRALPGRGFGIVATTSIKAGDLLVSEHAAVSVHHYEAVAGEANNSMSLLLTERLILAIEGDAVLRHRVTALEGYQTAYDESLSRSVSSSSNIDVAIFRGASAVLGHNAITINNGGEGLWVYSARFNHSCAPSARWHINVIDEILYIRAAVDIEVGEEVTISYGPGDAVMYCEKKRSALMMKTWGFICHSDTCRLCAGQRNADAEDNILPWVASPGPMPEVFRARLRRGSVAAKADVAAYLLSAENTLFNESKRVQDLKLFSSHELTSASLLPVTLNVAFFHAASLLFTGAAFFQETNDLPTARKLWKQVITCNHACPALLSEESARAAECLARTSSSLTNFHDGVDWIAMAARLRGNSEEGGGGVVVVVGIAI